GARGPDSGPALRTVLCLQKGSSLGGACETKTPLRPQRPPHQSHMMQTQAAHLGRFCATALQSKDPVRRALYRDLAKKTTHPILSLVLWTNGAPRTAIH